jgi:hypothetical protein
VAEETILQFLETPYQLEPPIPRLTRTDNQTAINNLNPKKSPGYDLITGQILKVLAVLSMSILSKLCNLCYVLADMGSMN